MILNRSQYKTQVEAFYSKVMGGIKCSLDNPKTFTEKIQWLKVYDSTFLKSYCADKLKLHNYSMGKLGKDKCVSLLGEWNSAKEIQWDTLPNQFAIKCNHGSRMNIICNPLNRQKINEYNTKLDKWLSIDYSTCCGYEFHYTNIQRKIFAENIIDDGNASLIDYKVYCFNGIPKFIQVLGDRSTLHTMNHYTLDWNPIAKYMRKEYKVNDFACPPHLDEMIHDATLLSKDFKFVRVDFYDTPEKLYLGELTFTPASGYMKYIDSNVDIELGEMLTL